jgi:uncharacterized membrane protein (UPF0127 family)
MRTVCLLLVGVLLIGGCYGDDESDASNRIEGNALIDTGDGSVLVRVEIADNPAERRVGLMNRESLPRDVGMAFIFFEDHSGGFWMKDTLIPLSIAFFDVEGEILKILDMEPCHKDPCPIYDPDVNYRGALEVNQGAFERWGVAVGDTLRISR